MMLKNDEEFICDNCKVKVEKLKYTSRDHCNKCLYSKHVDIIPGDRKNSCKGILRPIGYTNSNGKEQIIYECQSCKKRVKNIVADDDNRDLIIELSTNGLSYIIT